MKGFMVIMGIILCLAGAYAFGVAAFTPQVDIYSGKLIMSDSEYTVFKEALLQPSVEVKDIKSLSSSNPYIEFKVTVPQGQDFPFGMKSTDDWKTMTMGMGGFVFVFGLVFALISAKISVND
jgi:hypothetical protein